MLFGDKRKPSPAEVSAGLREQAFAISAKDVAGDKSIPSSGVWGLIMETGYPEGVASLVAFSDGTTSMYFSNGGGVIGAGQHAEVREASKSWINSASAFVKDLAPAAEHPLPVAGRVRFYARTFDGLLSSEAGENELGEGRHRLSALFHEGHQVIGRLRQLSMTRSRG